MVYTVVKRAGLVSKFFDSKIKEDEKIMLVKLCREGKKKELTQNLSDSRSSYVFQLITQPIIRLHDPTLMSWPHV